MNAPAPELIILSRDALLEALQQPRPEAVQRALAGVFRAGRRVLLTAPEPERWLPTRGTVDEALVNQQRLMTKVREGGGDLDGVYYVPRSLLTQDRNRAGALRDILKRYGLEAASACLISGSAPFLKAAQRLEIETVRLSSGKDLAGQLVSALERLG